ncbi:MAG TPA: hypothetical protein PLI95_16405 [Polyangiaceae bacterium]|nr:hypothetical protein [Polyangiaceae bacterium]
MLARLHAGWLLGTSLIVTLARRSLGRTRGLAEFRGNYRDDRLLPLSLEDHGALPEFSACIACGRCDEVEGGGKQPLWRGMMAFILSASRSMPDFEVAAKMAADLDDDALRALEERCPSRIPFRRVVGFVRHYAHRLDA